MPTETQITKMLTCTLTDDEWRHRASRLGAVTTAVRDQESAVDSAKERAKAQVKEQESILAGKKAEAAALARIVGEHKEEREVACAKVVDRVAKCERIVRTDTSEEIETSPLSTDEIESGASWSLDYKAGKARLIHPDDPGLVLRERALTDDEKQLHLPSPDARRTLSIYQAAWKKHRAGLLDDTGLALHGQWKLADNRRVITLDPGDELDTVKAYLETNNLAVTETVHGTSTDGIDF